MKLLKRMGVIVLFYLLIIGIQGKVFAANENITYKAEYKDAISYKITITGLEEEDENYIYSAIISQRTDIVSKDFVAALGPSFSISYDKATKQWTGSTTNGAIDINLKGPFEKQGQHYIYVAKLKKGSITYEMIDGPTKIATPKLPALGDRINVSASSTGANYSIKVNALHTYLHSDIQRTIKFYLGEIKDKTLLEKLDKNGKSAYGELLTYAKSQKNNLKEDSFKETKSTVLDYNIVKDYPIETGKYYFLYMILDDENGTYVEIEDIAPYNGYKNKNGEVELKNFEYQKQTSDENNNNNNTNQNNNQTNVNQNIQSDEQIKQKDNTVSKIQIPKAGRKTTTILVLCVVIIIAIVCYFQYQRYKKIIK